MIEELELETWDVAVLTETWREGREEVLDLPEGHLFLGSGGTRGERGVAILIHKRWKSGFRAFTAISERLALADFDIGGRNFRVAGVYMPHAGYPVDAVEEVYSAVDEARRHHREALGVGRNHIDAAEAQDVQ